MLQPYEVAAVECAYSMRDARGLLERFVHDSLPQLVIHNLDPTDVHQTVAQIAADLPEGMQTDPSTTNFEFGEIGAMGQMELHLDYDLPFEEDETLPITYHLTHSGLAVASLLGPGSRLMERVKSVSVIELGRELDRHFDTGYVDTELADTLCYQATLKPGSLLIFKNGFPLWHRMKDIVGTGRRSTAFDSKMAIHPGMGLRYQEGKRSRPLDVLGF